LISCRFNQRIRLNLHEAFKEVQCWWYFVES